MSQLQTMPQIQTKTPNVERKLDDFLNLLFEAKIIKKEEIALYRGKYTKAEQVFDEIKSYGKTPENDLTKVYAEAVGIPYIEIQSIDPAVTGLVDKELSKRFGFIPFSVDEKAKILQVAITSPERLASLNQNARKALENKLGYKIELFIASDSATKPVEGVSKKIENIEKKVAEALESADLEKIDIPAATFRKIPFDITEKLKMVVFAIEEDGKLALAISMSADPKIYNTIKLIEDKTSLRFRVYKASDEQINKAIEEYRKIMERARVQNTVLNSHPALPGEQKEEKGEVAKIKEEAPIETGQADNADAAGESKGPVVTAMEDPDIVKFLGKNQITIDDLKNFANENRVPQLIAGVILLAVKERASDIHIEPFEKIVKVRDRIDGELTDVFSMPSAMNAALVARVKILSKLKIDEQRVPQDGRFEQKVESEVIDMRVSTMPTVFGEKIVMRLLSKSKKLEKLEDLGLDGMGYDRIVKAMTEPYGVILATGPTGSGKSTTLYSILSQLNKPEVNIVTLEDPVEYQIEGINQVQIKPQIGFSFAEGLRSVLRQDPNIIMVGEIRDGETAELTTQAALTGHLVLSTLHTNSASGALPRLYNLGVEPFLLTSAVNAVIGQRLVRRLCSKCKVEIETPQSVIFETKKEFEKINLNHPIKFYKGKGCSECKNGFKGRIGIFEVLSMSEAIEDIVIAKKPENEIFTQAVKEGMITMKQDGLIKAVKGLTSVDEVIRATSET